MPPSFSVIVPTYNRAPLLEHCLTSVLAQRFSDYEVVVVDDGSTDDTEAVVARCGERVRVYRQRNGGPGAARNLGTQYARGRYLAFLDSDDVWFPWTLEVYADVIRAAGEPAFVAGKPFVFRAPGEYASVVDAPVKTRVFDDYYASGDEWRWWGASSFVVRADAFAAVGGFTNGRVNGEDAELALRLGTSRGFVQVCEPATFAYREHVGSAMANLERSYAGAWLAVTKEQAGLYPGGTARARERRRILTRHLRPVMLEALREGRRRDAWRMYRASLGWHQELGRWRFLFGFPFLAVASYWKAGGRRANEASQ